MKKSATAILFLLPLAFVTPGLADPWKDESGHGRGHHGHWHDDEWKEEYYDGNCKVERKAKHGKYKEEIKCDEPHHVAPPPVYVAPPAPVVVVPPPPSSGRIIVDISLGR